MGILNLEGRNTMKIFIKLSIILISVCGIISCTPKMTRDLWNGVYSEQAIVKEAQEKRDRYYSKETIEQKELRKRNQIFCGNLAKIKYPSVEVGSDNDYRKAYLYIDCMKSRGSPIY